MSAGRLRESLSRASTLTFTLFAGLAGFSTYFCMYAFRKPFSAVAFANPAGWSFALDFKIALVIAQVAGYALAKMIGVRVVSEMTAQHRAITILVLIGASWIALVLFAVLPPPLNVAAMFLNGLALGLIFGLVFAYLEGRRTSDMLGAMLCASFILSSGVVKSIGTLLLQAGLSSLWMPAAVGALFTPLLGISVWALEQIPPPSAADEAERVKRLPMSVAQRRDFLAAFAPGIILLVTSYVLLTALRDFRDNFAAEIWQALGFGGEAAVFTASEAPVTLLTLGVLGTLMIVRDNLRALLAIHVIILAGFALIGGATLAFQAHLIGPLPWMILNGAGLYMAYTPFNCMLFDRLVAYSGRMATAGFLIYVADASGYAGSVALLIWRNLFAVHLDWLQSFIIGAYAVSLGGIACALPAAIYFVRHGFVAARGGMAAHGALSRSSS